MYYHRPDKIWILFLRAIALTINFLLRPLLILLLPLNSYFERKVSRRLQAEFEQEIRDAMPFLFLDLGAVVVENKGVPFPPPFDGAFVTLEVGALFIRFERGRGNLNVLLAQLNNQSNWRELDVLLGAIADPTHIQRWDIDSLVKVAFELRTHWEQIEQLLRAKQDSSVVVALAEFSKGEEAYRLAYQNELNRRLYDNNSGTGLE